MSSGLEDLSLFELFRMEAEEQVRVLQSGLIRVESKPDDSATLAALMRAAHSLKGAARIIGLDLIVDLTHAMEERLVAAQVGAQLSPADTDKLLQATDWLARLQQTPENETANWLATHTPSLSSFIATFTATLPPLAQPVQLAQPTVPSPGEPNEANLEEDLLSPSSPQQGARERSVRIAAERFNEILSLVSEVLVTSRTLVKQSETLERSRRAMMHAQYALQDVGTNAATHAAALRDIDRQTVSLGAHVAEFDVLSRANERTSERLYRTVLAGRLRPFSEGITAVTRLVRDTARGLDKQAQMEVRGERTRVDRDILERLEAPLSHLITNAIDHGLETPEQRLTAGKPAAGQLKLHARHENGRLVITLQDDGRGIHRDQLREHVIVRGLASRRTAEDLADSELLEFLFLPGFSTRDQVSTVSGRGVGLNVVQSMVQEAGGSVTVTSEPGAGTAFRLTLPVTRSVVKVLRLQVEGELYAVPLVRIDRIAHLEPQLDTEGHATIHVDDHTLPVRSLAHLLGFSNRPLPNGTLPLMLSGGIAFAADKFIDEIELPVRRLDSRLGKIAGVSAASLDENGLPLLILDMEDLVQTAQGRAATEPPHGASSSDTPRILVVDDSHTVREIVRRLLVRAGYNVTAAQNGQEAWNLLRLNEYDLLISDVDMPQMNGIELVTKIRENARMARMPVMILSYKNHDEDRRRGLQAGADFYLTKGDFQKDSFRQAIVDLIGPAEAHA
jgi:two-component system sensor histidine kinase and response regulator WspE